MARIGYIRVSTEDQNTARQEIQMQDLDKLYIEKVSGKSTQRPELKKMMDYIREGGEEMPVEEFFQYTYNRTY